MSSQSSSSSSSLECNITKLPMMEKHPLSKITIVHMSDSHISHQFLKTIPNGDIFICSGDISHKSEWKEVEQRIAKKALKNPQWSREELYESAPSIISFNEWIGKLPHPIKIVIAGNHEMGFNGLSRDFIQNNVLSNAIYLQDQSLLIKYKGRECLKLYGTPWTTSSNMGFSISKDKINQIWKRIPNDTDVLITHLPPFGVMDLASGKDPAFFCDYCQKEHKYRRHWGNVDLRNRVIELNSKGKLQAHLYGHVHEFHGTTIEPNTRNSARPLIYSNAASVGTHTDTDIRTPNVIEIQSLLQK